MKKMVKNIGGDGTIGITFDKEDKQFYGIAKGDYVIFEIKKVLDEKRNAKYKSEDQ